MPTDGTTLLQQEWEEGDRALERERGDTGRYERLLEQVEIVTDELRRRVGQTYSLGELAPPIATRSGGRARPSRIVRLRPAGRAISRSSWPPRSSPPAWRRGLPRDEPAAPAPPPHIGATRPRRRRRRPDSLRGRRRTRGGAPRQPEADLTVTTTSTSFHDPRWCKKRKLWPDSPRWRFATTVNG